MTYVKPYQNILEYFWTNLKFWLFWLTDQSYYSIRQKSCYPYQPYSIAWWENFGVLKLKPWVISKWTVGLLCPSTGVASTLFFPLSSLLYFLTNCANFPFLLVPPDKILMLSPWPCSRVRCVGWDTGVVATADPLTIHWGGAASFFSRYSTGDRYQAVVWI